MTKSSLLSLYLSVFFVLIVYLIYLFINKKKSTYIKINKNLEIDIENYTLNLVSNSIEENIDFFKKIISIKHKIIQSKKNMIIYEEDEKIKCLLPLFDSYKLNLEICLKSIKKAIKNKINYIVILCPKIDTKDKFVLDKIKNIQIVIYDKYKIYTNIFKEYNIYPTIEINTEKNIKTTLKQLFLLSFKKENAKHYFFSGLLIFFCSFFVRLNIYYVLSSSILFLLTIFSIISKNTIKNDNTYK